MPKDWRGERIPVLDQGWVELQDMMGDDLAIVNAARTSYLGDSKGDARDKKLLFYLMQHRHDGPFEMVELRFRLHAPEIVWRQLLRHRTGNFNLQSYRYTQAQDEAFYIPAEWRTQSTTNKQSSADALPPAAGDALSAQLREHIAAGYALYEDALAQGVAREMARLFLPAFGLYSTGVAKFDARNLMHFLGLRMAEDAQWEIRQYAQAMYTIFADMLPWCAEAYAEFRQPGA
ncbi:MAG: FAD-dependent thymidylate synthase [Anaerolineales bacterium]